MKKLLACIMLSAICLSQSASLVMAEDAAIIDVAYTQQSAAPKLLTRKTEKELKAAIKRGIKSIISFLG